jgi:hypothetical protein
MLETIRSRAPKLTLCPVPTEDMRAHLMQTERAFAALSEAEREEILLIASGSIGRAKELLDPKERRPITTRRGLASAFVEQQTGKWDATGALTLMTRMGSKRDEILPVLEDILTALRDLALLKRTELAPLCFYTDRERTLEICDSTSLQAILSLSERVESCRRALYRNANVKLALTTLFLMGH